MTRLSFDSYFSGLIVAARTDLPLGTENANCSVRQLVYRS